MDKKINDYELASANLYELPEIFGMSKKEAKIFNEDLDETKEELLEVGSKELDKKPDLTTDELALKFAMIERDKSKRLSLRRKILNLVIKEMEKKNEKNI